MLPLCSLPCEDTIRMLLLLFSLSVVSHSLWSHGLQHARPPCPSPTPRVYPNSCPLSQWCHPTISSSVVSFSSCVQSFPASGSFPMSRLWGLFKKMRDTKGTFHAKIGSIKDRNDQNSQPLLWPPDAKSQLTRKDPDARKDWRQEEKGTTEDRMVNSITDSTDRSLSKLWEIVKDRWAWRVVVCGVTKSQTWLSTGWRWWQCEKNAQHHV